MDGRLQHKASSVDFSQVDIKELQLLFQEQQRCQLMTTDFSGSLTERCLSTPAAFAGT